LIRIYIRNSKTILPDRIQACRDTAGGERGLLRFGRFSRSMPINGYFLMSTLARLEPASGGTLK
jgi:hypothetical protein